MVSPGLVEQLEYFKTRQSELVKNKKYYKKFLIIKDKEVKGAYNSEIEAYIEGKKKFELGTFIIQECLEGEQCYTHTFYAPWVCV